MEDNINGAVEVDTKRVVPAILEQTMEDGFPIGFDEHKKELMASLRNMVGRALIDCVKQGCLSTSMVPNVDMLDTSLNG